ncbi:MAG: hypothetical protein H7095_00680 [Pseudopedobacter sp.]|nr:hypothetical protein [Deinococcales bacterium]
MMFKTAIAALGMTALLAACGGDPPPAPSLTGITVLNNDAGGVTPLCAGGITASITIEGQTVSVPSVVAGTKSVVAYPAAFINQIKKGKSVSVQATCTKTSNPATTVAFSGTVTEDYKDTGSDYSLTVNGTKTSVSGYSICFATSDPNNLGPCVFGGGALGLPAPKKP